jgi:hypothetical protein
MSGFLQHHRYTIPITLQLLTHYHVVTIALVTKMILVFEKFTSSIHFWNLSTLSPSSFSFEEKPDPLFVLRAKGLEEKPKDSKMFSVLNPVLEPFSSIFDLVFHLFLL